MAWTRGDLITAAKLNSENTGKSQNYSIWFPNSSGSIFSDWRFSHQRTGRIMYLTTSGTAYWWAKGDGTFWFRNSQGATTEHSLWYEAGNTNGRQSRTIYAEEWGHGVGFYRAKVWQNRGGGDIDAYWAQDDCKAGEKLVHWENPISGGNRIPGTLLTAAVLNSGLVGTM